MSLESRYLFTLMPPKPLVAKIDVLRKEVAANFNCHKALNPPVHITLFTLFNATQADEEILEKINHWAIRQAPMLIRLNGFGFFENPTHPVFFIDVEKTEVLRTFNTGLTTQVRKMLPHLKAIKLSPYHPHITLAYRDTTPEILPAFKAAYRQRPLKESFDAETLYLWRHNGRHWDVIQEFPLAPVIDGYAAGSQAALF